MFWDSVKDREVDELLNLLDTRFRSQYGFKPRRLLSSFTLTTDYCNVMANLAGASLSPAVAPLHEEWRGFMSQLVKKIMKTYLSGCAGDQHRNWMTEDLKAVKTLVLILE